MCLSLYIIPTFPENNAFSPVLHPLCRIMNGFVPALHCFCMLLQAEFVMSKVPNFNVSVPP